jgi:hypothetical protein
MLLKARIIITNPCAKINPFFFKLFSSRRGKKKYTKGEKMYIIGNAIKRIQ